MGLIEFIQAHHAQNIVYLVIFIGMFLDAALVIFFAVFLLAQGGLKPEITVPILIIGALAEQLLWYEIGKHLGKWQWLNKWVDRFTGHFDHHLAERPLQTLVVSKFVYGLHRSILVRAGMLKMRFENYVKYTFTGVLIWLMVVGFFAYVFSASYVAFKQFWRYAEIVPLVLIAIFFLIELLFTQAVKRKWWSN